MVRHLQGECAPSCRRQREVCRRNEKFAVDISKAHEATSSHKRESAAADAATRRAMESPAGRMLVSMNKVLVDKLKIKFRTVHALAKHARPYTDYVWQCSVNERKGLVVGTDYRSDKSASEFAHDIAEVSLLLAGQYIDSLHYLSNFRIFNNRCDLDQVDGMAEICER